MNVRTKVTELEPGWLLLQFEEPKPPAEQRALWLNRTLADWLGDHPGRVVTRVLPIEYRGELVAVHAWLDAVDAPTAGEMQIRIAGALVRTVPKEHLEAMLQSAREIFMQRPAAARLIVVNRRKIAVVFDRYRRRVSLAPFGRLKLTEETKLAFHEWLTNPSTQYFVLELPSG